MLKSLITLALLGGAAISPLSAKAQDYQAIIIVSPQGDSAEREQMMKYLLKTAVTMTDPGEQSIFFDGLNTKEICAFAVPDKSSYRSDKAKLQANGACVGKLLKIAKDAAPGTQGVNLDPMSSLKQAVSAYPMSEETAIIINGSPLFDSAKEPAFSMSDSYVPSEGNIVAKAGKSPFSFNGYEGQLNGAYVYWITPSDAWAMNADHRVQVQSHWTKSIVYLGGVPMAFSHNWGSILRNAETQTGSALPTEPIENDKIEMVQVVQAVRTDTPIHERRLSTRGLTERAITSATDIEVGITWDCGGCDVDLYVTPKTGAQTLYFANKRSELGRFHKDYTSGRSLSNGLERVTLPGPLNLSDMTIEIRHYSGRATNGIRGELRIAIGGETFAKAFELTAAPNGRGRTVVIDPMSVVR